MTAANEPVFETVTIYLPARGATLKDFEREGRKFGACQAANWMKLAEWNAAAGRLTDEAGALKDWKDTLDKLRLAPGVSEYHFMAFEKAAMREWQLRTKLALRKPPIG